MYLFRYSKGVRPVFFFKMVLKALVSGNYNWIPAEKDQRKGTLDGTLTDNTVTAQYRFIQEGMEQTTTLKIRLMDDKAQVE